jgi:hypothetical protein
MLRVFIGPTENIPPVLASVRLTSAEKRRLVHLTHCRLEIIFHVAQCGIKELQKGLQMNPDPVVEIVRLRLFHAL